MRCRVVAFAVVTLMAACAARADWIDSTYDSPPPSWPSSLSLNTGTATVHMTYDGYDPVILGPAYRGADPAGGSYALDLLNYDGAIPSDPNTTPLWHLDSRANIDGALVMAGTFAGGDSVIPIYGSNLTFHDDPGIAASYGWANTTGVITGSASSFAVVPEPTNFLLAAVGLFPLLRRSRRFKSRVLSGLLLVRGSVAVALPSSCCTPSASCLV